MEYSRSTTEALARYIALLQEGTEKEREAAAIVGSVYIGLIRMNCARPPRKG